MPDTGVSIVAIPYNKMKTALGAGVVASAARPPTRLSKNLEGRSGGFSPRPESAGMRALLVVAGSRSSAACLSSLRGAARARDPQDAEAHTARLPVACEPRRRPGPCAEALHGVGQWRVHRSRLETRETYAQTGGLAAGPQRGRPVG